MKRRKKRNPKSEPGHGRIRSCTEIHLATDRSIVGILAFSRASINSRLNLFPTPS